MHVRISLTTLPLQQEHNDYCPRTRESWILKRYCLLLKLVFACWLNKGMKRRDPHRCLWCLSLLSITESLHSQMCPLFHTNAVINCFNRHAHCRAPTSAPIYISKRPASIYMNASQLTNSQTFVRRAGSPLPQNERNAITQSAQRPPASIQEKRPPVQPTSINPHSYEPWVLCSVPYSHSCRYPLHLRAAARLRLRLLSILWPCRPSHGACAANTDENSLHIRPRSRKREPDCGVNCSRLFSSSLGVQSWAASTSQAEWRGSCPRALQWHPGPIHSASV